jgi:hypothetical protein
MISRRSGAVQLVRVAAVAAAAALIAAASASARGTLDQSTMPPGGYLTPLTLGYSDLAQTFTAGISGYLDTVELSASPQSVVPGRYRLSVEGTTAQGTPDGAVIAQAIVDACHLPGVFQVYDVPFSPAAQLVAGTRYALVFVADPSNLPGSSIYWSQGQGTATGAEAFFRMPPGSGIWQPSTAGPQAFSTYVSADAPAPLTRSASTITLTAQPNPVKRYRNTVITAHVTDTGHPGVAPYGTVRFVINGYPSDPALLDANGNVQTTGAWATAGDKQISAWFCPGDLSVISSETTATVTVSAELTASSTILLFDPDTPVAWQDDRLTAKVISTEPVGVIPTGTIQFSEDDGTPIGDPVALDSTGAAVIHASAGAGTYRVHAAYSGDDVFSSSEAIKDVTVSQASSVTSILTSANPANFGSPITWVLDVSAVAPSEGIPTGSISITVDGVPRGTFTLDDNGQVGLQVTNLAPGTHSVSVHYSGDVDYRPSDATINQAVSTPPAPASAASAPAAVIKPLGSAALLSALKMPATLTVRSGAVTLGTATNPPIRSLTASLTAAGGLRSAAATATSLGRVSVTVPAGQRRTVKVKLNRAGRRALRHHRSLRVTVRLTAVDPSGHTVKATAKRLLSKRGATSAKQRHEDLGSRSR